MPRQRRHYGNPPIVEAVIDIRVSAEAAVSIAALEDIGRAEKERYPKKLAGVEIVEEVELLADEQKRKTKRTPIGFIFKNQDERQILQAQIRGFAFSRLRPYRSWEEFSAEARRLWDVYRSATHPEKITRVAVRYVNRFDFPGPNIELGTYLEVSPKVPDSINKTGSFLLRTVTPNPTLDATLVLNEAHAPAEEGRIGIILDLDLFSETPIPADNDLVWRRLSELHAHIENVFEDCITDATRELIS